MIICYSYSLLSGMKGSTLLWGYSQTEVDFGHWQARELKENLTQVLKDFAVEVYDGKGFVEVRPIGCGKDKACQVVIDKYRTFPDFVLCIGDDTSDERMFEFFKSYNEARSSSNHHAESAFLRERKMIHTVVVGQKPSAAQSYVDCEKDVEKKSISMVDVKSLVTKRAETGSRQPRPVMRKTYC